MTWLVTALVALGSWFLLPGSGLDRWSFTKLAHTVAAPPFEIQGEGSQTRPWQLQPLLGRELETDSDSVTVDLEDDPDGIFQTFPHSPIDVAVVLTNLKRLGTGKLACSVLLAWEDPDAIGLTALEVALADFESVVLAAPVTRGPIMEPMPPSFRRASIGLDQVRGDLSTLPQINRISLPILIHGGENTWTGFQTIDSEPGGEAIHLLARWEDRIILGFPVLAAMQQLGIEPAELRVVVDSHLQFGDSGPSVAIDEFGRLAFGKLAIPVMESKDLETLSAEILIDAEPGSPGIPELDTAILRDMRSNADLSIQSWNQLLPELVHRIKQGSQALEPETFPRLHVGLEMLILLGLALGLSFSSLGGRLLHSAICLLATGLLLLGWWWGMTNGLWLPGPSIAATIAAAWLCGLLLGRRRRQTTSMPRLDRLDFESTR